MAVNLAWLLAWSNSQWEISVFLSEISVSLSEISKWVEAEEAGVVPWRNGRFQQDILPCWWYLPQTTTMFVKDNRRAFFLGGSLAALIMKYFFCQRYTWWCQWSVSQWRVFRKIENNTLQINNVLEENLLVSHQSLLAASIECTENMQ